MPQGAASGDGGHIAARIMSMGRMHHAFTGTGAAALAVACAIPGSVPHQMLTGSAEVSRGAEAEVRDITVHHTSGSMAVGAAVGWEPRGGPKPSRGRLEGEDEHGSPGKWVASRVAMSRSARRLMDGCMYVPKGVWE